LALVSTTKASCQSRSLSREDEGLTQAEPPNAASWLALMRRPSEWQHEFGPPASPVIIAGSSEPISRLVHAIKALGRPDSARCVVVEGGDGCGKSLAAAAFQALCQEDGRAVLLVNEGSEPASVMPRLKDADALIVDDLDLLPAVLRRGLFERRHTASMGCLLTLSRLNPLERQLLTVDDDHHPIGRWEERPRDVLIIASLAWNELGLTPSLPDLCVDGVAEVLGRGPWSRGAHSIRRAIALVAEAIELQGYFEQSPHPIGAADVLEALVAVIREDQPPEQDDEIRIVVEGSTDATYIKTAARLAYDHWGFDLLAGCHVAPPGEDREGGADKAVRELFLLDARGITSVALFDDDDPGRNALKDARKFSRQKVHLLPAEFDPLKNPNGSGKTEIEDLVSLSLVERFYAENPTLEPEERTARGDLRRVVVSGPD
jgi:hypothetical protein